MNERVAGAINLREINYSRKNAQFYLADWVKVDSNLLDQAEMKSMNEMNNQQTNN